MAMRRSAGASSLTRRPPMASSPAETVSSPAMMRSSVVLPQPEGPTKTQNSPSFTSRSMSRRISTVPKDLQMPRSVTSGMAISPRPLLDRTGRKAAHKLAREQDIEHEDRRDREGERGDHRVPVDDILADELLHPERDGLLA